MKFTDAYQLNLYLFNRGLISGLYLSERGEYEIESTIKDRDLLKLLDEIWGDWRWGETDGESNAIHGGFYNLFLDSHDNLAMDVSINDNFLDSWGNPFDIEKILSIVCDNLSLDSIDKEELLEYQICVDIELEYEDIEKSDYTWSTFSIKSFEEDDELSTELNLKLNQQSLDIIKKGIVQYLLEIHKKENSSYEGFSLIIEDNYFSDYSGTGCEEVNGLRSFLENYMIDIELKVDTLK
jgi:hypothetical protein